MSLSIAVLHNPRRAERKASLEAMIPELSHPSVVWRIFADPPDRPWQQFKTVLALRQWEWAAATETSHHLFLTDDLHLAPGFVPILSAMIEVAPKSCIGLLSNHPEGPSLFITGGRWYRCNSWIVGPAYLVPHEDLVEFIAWRKALPPGDAPGGADWYNDDSSLNEWITQTGRSSLHPLPTIVEHRADLESTVGHGDRFSRERVSWRTMRHPIDIDGQGNFKWFDHARIAPEIAQRMATPDFWLEDGSPATAPMLAVGG